MQIRNRLFPYPVLHPGSDDYKTSKFEAKMNMQVDGPGALKLTCIGGLQAPDLLQLIDDDKAAYAFHIECGYTAKRLCYIDRAPFVRKSLPIASLSGRVERCAFVVATKEILAFEGRDWNDAYAGLNFHIQPGNILAYSELEPLTVKHPVRGGGETGVFTVRPDREITNGIAVVSPEDNRVVIRLGEQEFREYEQFAKSAQYVPALRSMILLPALVYLFGELKTPEGWEQWQDSAWLRVLETQYRKQGIDLRQEVLETDKNAITLAQECLASPITAALESFTMSDDDQTEG